MTNVVFKLDGQRITEFKISGHTGYDVEGHDILCAAVTSAVRLTECTLNTVMGLGIAFEADEDSAEISCSLPTTLPASDEDFSQSVVSSLMVYLTELKEEYPDYINIVEQ